MSVLSTELRPPTLTRLPRPDAVVSIAAPDDQLPDWLTNWCRQSGRGPLPRRLPGPASHHVSLPLIRTVAGLAGHTVFVARPSTGHPGPRRVIAAIHDLPTDVCTLVEAARCARFLGAEVEITHAVPVSFAERSVGLAAALDRAAALLAASARQLAGDAFPVRTTLRRMYPHELVGTELEADLLVLGWSHQHEPLGPVTLAALNTARCPLLLVPGSAGHL
jgi:nucleotide-binding universal stress UspA family protein